jgi:hypothetical protein
MGTSRVGRSAMVMVFGGDVGANRVAPKSHDLNGASQGRDSSGAIEQWVASILIALGA